HTAWRFEARMDAVRATVADRATPLPLEARDISKALDGGGMIRPTINKLHLDPAGALWLRAQGLEAVLSASLPVALVLWLLAALMPPGAFPALATPADLWAFATRADPPAPETVHDPARESQSQGRS